MVIYLSEFILLSILLGHDFWSELKYLYNFWISKLFSYIHSIDKFETTTKGKNLGFLPFAG